MGNDVVLVIFRDGPGEKGFNPEVINSQFNREFSPFLFIVSLTFNHADVFCVVQPEGDGYRYVLLYQRVNSCFRYSHFSFFLFNRLAFSCKQGVNPSDPYLSPHTFPKTKEFREFLLSKCECPPPYNPVLSGRLTASFLKCSMRR